MFSIDTTISDHVLKWVIEAVHPEATIVSIQQLQGGISSLVHGISLSIHGEVRSVVLRQFNNAEWVQEQPDLALREAESLLRAAQVLGVQTPKLIAFDQTGSQCGTPALLMTRLEGSVVLEPKNKSHWIKGMAEALVRIHQVDASHFPWTFAPYCDAAKLNTSSWSKIPDKWQVAADMVKSSLPSAAARFIHRDYHPTNILWNGEEVSGIVDWVNGCVGPAGIDVGHCRVNLAQLYDVSTADDFLSCYQDHAGASFSYDPYWDLVTLIDFAYWPPEVYGGWTALGMTGLTEQIIIERLDSYLVSLLNRVS
ncbi:aminoglycoside phosphotransferase family protein [Paenibacillus sp. RC67]|uniref:phosphotransferase family protein n=1 Tax=Paenibacillus sp. RC67 TaxID=3039392 RepID=UPI0024ADF78C|nr:aminoglycoside phosphotransferase family protein [Paenibacillus sp. RC67]